MTAEQKRLRENSRLSADGWSNWEKAMVPIATDLDVADNILVPRAPTDVGFICSNISKAFHGKAQHCGIYEWRATRIGQPNRVVYVGSTCRSKQGALRGRILEYCNNGSHKKDLINDALSRGYELWVRVKIVAGPNPRREDAEGMENQLLDTCDYAWNIRRNEQIRYILP